MDMRDTIRRVARVYFIGFLVLTLAAGYWQVIGAETIARDPALNAARLQAEAARVHRGRILTADGTVLVQTAADGSRAVAELSLAHLLGYSSFRYGTYLSSNAPLPRDRSKPAAPIASVFRLSPDHFRRPVSRRVSYYALFKWWLLLSQHPGCLCDSTTFTT